LRDVGLYRGREKRLSVVKGGVDDEGRVNGGGK